MSFVIEAKERVYLIDTGIPESLGNQCGPQIRYDNQTVHSHGIHMVTEIYKEAKNVDYCIQSYDVYDEEEKTIPVSSIVKALRHIATQPVGIINMSMDGGYGDIIEQRWLRHLAKLGYTINIASGNDGKDLRMGCTSYPACYFRLPTSNVNVISNKEPYANTQGPVTHVGDLPTVKAGTSGSTARFTGKLIKDRESNFRFYNVTPRSNYVTSL